MNTATEAAALAARVRRGVRWRLTAGHQVPGGRLRCTSRQLKAKAVGARR